MKSTWRRALVPALLLVAAALPASAQAPQPGQPSPNCPRLESQLAAFDRTAGDTSRADQLRKFEEAAANQQAEIDRQEATARKAGCESSFFVLFNSQQTVCGPINNKIQQMNDNLARIQRDIEKMRSDPAPARDAQRRAILTAMAQNNCGATSQQAAVPVPQNQQQVAAPPPAPATPQVAAAQQAAVPPPGTRGVQNQPLSSPPVTAAPLPPPPQYQQRSPQPAPQVAAAPPPPPAAPPPQQRAGLFETLFGPRSVFTPGGGAAAPNAPDSPDPSALPSGTFRTVCVRTCDGYFYPISNSTNASRFAEDEKSCRQSCPASEVQLYAYRNPGEDMNQAVAVSGGQPYTSLPTAYRYRTSLDQACSCRRPGETWSQALKSVEETVEQGDIVVNEQKARALSQPRADAQGKPIRQAPAPAAKPDAKVTSSPMPAPATPSASDKAADDAPSKPDPNRTVRTVGPTFLPAR